MTTTRSTSDDTQSKGPRADLLELLQRLFTDATVLCDRDTTLDPLTLAERWTLLAAALLNTATLADSLARAARQFSGAATTRTVAVTRAATD